MVTIDRSILDSARRLKVEKQRLQNKISHVWISFTLPFFIVLLPPKQRLRTSAAAALRTVQFHSRTSLERTETEGGASAHVVLRAWQKARGGCASRSEAFVVHIFVGDDEATTATTAGDTKQPWPIVKLQVVHKESTY